jgi:hypothetical protein
MGDPDETVVTGYYGTERLGLISTERMSLETSMVPLQINDQTYGLPTMQIDWHHEWHKDGQGGHCRFRHGQLLARFASAAAQLQFAQIWEATFERVPQFEPTPPNMTRIAGT